MLAPEEVIPSYRVLLPQIEGVPLAVTNISEDRNGLLSIAGTRNLNCGKGEDPNNPLVFKTGFVLTRISPHDSVKSWPSESLTWLSPRRVDPNTGLLERSVVIDLNSSGDVIFFRQTIDPFQFSDPTYTADPPRYFLRHGENGIERMFRPGFEPLGIDDHGRILVRITGHYLEKPITAIISSGELKHLKITSDDRYTEWRNSITSLSSNGDLLLEAVGRGHSKDDGLLKALKLQRGGDCDLPMVYFSGAAAVKLGGDLMFAFEHQYFDKYGTGPRNALYVTNDGAKGGLFAPSNSGDACPSDSQIVRDDPSKPPYYFIVGGSTSSTDGQVWIVTEEQAARGESEVGLSLSGFAPDDVQINEITRVTPRGVLLAKTTSPREGFESVLLVPNGKRGSSTDWGD